MKLANRSILKVDLNVDSLNSKYLNLLNTLSLGYLKILMRMLTKTLLEKWMVGHIIR